MKRLTVRHSTTYRYANPVSFGEHRLMLRPRDSHDLRLVDATLTLSPPGAVRWIHDVFGNSIAIVTFAEQGTELRIESVLELERYGLPRLRFELDENAGSYPFIYTPDDRSDLGRTLERHPPDPQDVVGEWVKGFVRSNPTDTLALLADINAGIRAQLTYQARDDEGTQSPVETLERGMGSCRDYALLMIEAVRCLGFGARFVSGYLYDPALDAADDAGIQGAGATHAWAEIYLPGAGWVEYDPTNGLIGSENLIRVAVTRDASQAVPVAGSFTGRPADYLGMTIEVTVSARGARSPEAEPPAQAPAMA